MRDVMTKYEFLEKWNQEVLESIRIVVGKNSNIPYSINCYEENGIWIIKEIGERQDCSIIIEGAESVVFEKLNKIVRGEIKLKERRRM